MTDDDLSRHLNAFFGGDPAERFSSRCYRLRFTSIKWLALWLIVDQHFAERGDRNHCRRVYLEDRQRLGHVEAERMINAGL
jgi:hypothetical protein